MADYYAIVEFTNYTVLDECSTEWTVAEGYRAEVNFEGIVELSEGAVNMPENSIVLFTDGAVSIYQTFDGKDLYPTKLESCS